MKRWLLFVFLFLGMMLPAVTGEAADAGVPVSGSDVKDGQYEIEVTSSSSMFRIVKAELFVENGEMEAVLQLGGTGYLKLFMGTGEEAGKASEEAFIPFVETEDGAYTYRVPVPALNQEIDCAAYSKRKETWYDRKLVFLASSLPKEALKIELPEEVTEAEEETTEETVEEATTEEAAKIANPNLIPCKSPVKDGNYTMEVSLEGGSGKATIQSPARVTVTNQEMQAEIVWSSPNYDYMYVNGVKYDPVNAEGNSTFEIPIYRLDEKMEVVADTTAMSKPHEIAYTLTFHSNTLRKERGSFPVVFVVFGVVLVVVVIALVMRKKRKA